MKKDWIWMPHAAHFICGPDCQFTLATYVNGYIISTVGELVTSRIKSEKFETVALGRLYETMVFKAKKGDDNKCCPYVMDYGDDGDLDQEGYNDPEKAYLGHLAMCEKYDKDMS